jgi:hypothetical protein
MEQLTVYKSPYQKIRVGNRGDGGYVISNIPTQYDVLISGGISNDISFEQDFLNRYPSAKCFGFDGTVNDLPTSDSRITFVKKNLGMYETETTTNLESYFETYDNIFLKLDIEGHEFRLLPVILKYFHKIKQIVVEVHSPNDIRTYPSYYSGLNDITNDTMFSLFSSINKTHTLVHIHGNNGCGIGELDGIRLPYVFECTYIRNDFVPNKIENDIPFPTNLDYPNRIGNPEHILKGFPYSTLEYVPILNNTVPIVKRLSYLRRFR